MSSYNPLFICARPDGVIGQKLRVGYDDIAEPVPPHLTALLKVLEIAATETSQQSASSARFADHQTSDGELLIGAATSPLRFEKPDGLRA